MAIRNSAQLALAARRLAQTSQTREVLTDQADTPGKIGVSGGFRAGKRKRGNSLIKRAPKTTARAITYRVYDSDGNYVGRVRTITTKPE